MGYSLHNLTPDSLDDLKELLSTSDGLEQFLEDLRSFLLGDKASAADRDSAFSLAAELSAFGVIDQVPIERLSSVLSGSTGDKLLGFREGLPSRIRMNLLPEAPKKPKAAHLAKAVAASKTSKSIRRPIYGSIKKVKQAVKSPTGVSTQQYVDAKAGLVGAVLREAGFTVSLPSQATPAEIKAMLVEAKKKKFIESFELVHRSNGLLRGFIVGIPEKKSATVKKTATAQPEFAVKPRRVYSVLTKGRKELNSA